MAVLLIYLQLFYKDKLQKIQKSCAVLVFNRYYSAADILWLGWLPIKECTEMRIVNLSYQALHSKNFPKYLKLNFAPKKCLLQACNGNGPMAEISGHRNSLTARATNCLMNLLKILDNWAMKILLSLKQKNIFTIEH